MVAAESSIIGQSHELGGVKIVIRAAAGAVPVPQVADVVMCAMVHQGCRGEHRI